MNSYQLILLGISLSPHSIINHEPGISSLTPVLITNTS